MAGGLWYAPQNNIYNNYYAPNSNSVTKEAIDALESRLNTATNKIEFTVGEVRKLAQALRDLDQRTSGIEKLPDGRTKFGDLVAGEPKALMEIEGRADKSYQGRDYINALSQYEEAIKILESIPSDAYSIHDSLTPQVRSRLYNMAANTANILRRYDTAFVYAKKANDIFPGLRNIMMYSFVNANLGQDKYMKHDLNGAFPLLKEALDLYETAEHYVNNEGDFVGYINFTNSEGKADSKIYSPKDELYSPSAAAQLYGEAAFAAFVSGDKTVAADYAHKAMGIEPTNPFVLSVFKIVLPTTNSVHWTVI